MKTAEELLSTLPKEVKDRFMENVKNLNPDSYNNILEQEFESMRYLIGEVFLWDNTPEGCEYWGDISRGLLKSIPNDRTENI